MSAITQFLNKCLHFADVSSTDLAHCLTEAAGRNTYVETLSKYADTLHRKIEDCYEIDLKMNFGLVAKKHLKKLKLRNVVLAIDVTEDLYWGDNGGLNVRQIKPTRGADEAFKYISINVIKPRPLPLMSIPYTQGEDLATKTIELLEFTQSLPITVKLVLFDRGFYIAHLIDYLEAKHMKYIILAPENSAIKRYVMQTDRIAIFSHEMYYKKDKSSWKPTTRIVVIKGVDDWAWTFATNVKISDALRFIPVYKQRWQIETDFRVHDEARIKSKSNYAIVRYFYFLTSLLLMSCWQVNRKLHPKVPFKRYLKEVEYLFLSEILGIDIMLL